MASVPLVLASASPRRRDLLTTVGLAPLVRPVALDESPQPGEKATAYVARLAHAKATAAHTAGDPPEVVLAADTTVALDGTILGKPADARQAHAMLTSLAGRRHAVHTAVTVTDGDRSDTVVVSATVTFLPLTSAQIAGYVATGEPFDKAGGYGVQGAAGAFVERVEGSYTTVVGLPVAETLALLAAAGVTPRGTGRAG